MKFIGSTLIIAIMFTSVGLSMPDDLSVNAFEEFKQGVEKEVEKELIEEFKLKEGKINKLSKPFQIGETVTINLIQGGRKRVVTGKFRGVKGQHAEIGDRSILLSDIEELDRDRLFFGGEIQLLQLKINQLRKSMEEDKSRRREILIGQKYKQAGYTKKFFENTVGLGGRFWPLSDLGDKRFRILVKLNPDSEFADVTMKFKLGVNTSCIVLFGKESVYFSNLANDNHPQQNKSFSGKKSFQIFQTELMEAASLVGLQEKLKVWIIHDEWGGWLLRPDPDARYNSGPNSHKAEYTLHLVQSSIRKSSRKLEQQFSEMVTSARDYQESLQNRINALEEAAREEEAQRLKELQEKEAELAKQREQEEILKNRIQEVEKHYIWFTPKTAHKNYTTLKNVLSLNEFDDINKPSSIDGKPVEKFTEWIKVPTTSRILFGRKYRILKVIENHIPKFLVQYRASYVNPNLSVTEFTPSITVKLTSGEEQTWIDTYTLPSSWAGEFHAAHEIPLDLIEHSKIDTVVIEQPRD